MKRMIALLAIACVLPLSVIAQQTATTKDGKTVILNSDGTWKYTDSSTGDASSLSIEAALIYRSGDVKPIARTEFLLLDQSMVSILKSAGIEPYKGYIQPDSYDLAVLNTYAYSIRGIMGNRSVLPLATPAIMPHVVGKVTTDFTGKATIESIKPGTYFLQAYYDAARNYCIWDLKVELKPGQTKIVIDQKNAAYCN